MSLGRCAIFVAALAGSAAGCGSDDATAGWAIVKVDIVDGPPLASICIDSTCREFEGDSAVRGGEFSAYVEPGTTFEVLRVGESSGEGSTAGSPVGGCMLLRLANDSGAYIGGCGMSPDGE